MAFAMSSLRRSLRSVRLAEKKLSGTMTPSARGRVLRVDESVEGEVAEEDSGRSRLPVQAISPLLFLITCVSREEEAGGW